MAKILIIGGGIIGLCSAYYLSDAGHQVTVFDKGDMTDNCSYGNAGMIVPSHFVPLAAPGMISQGIRWMFSSKSPFYVRPSLNPELLSWGIQFLKKANTAHVENSALPLVSLSLLSKSLYKQLAVQSSFDFQLQEKGILMFYKTEKAAEEEAHLARRGLELGLDMQVLNPTECRALQPDLSIDVLGAVHYRCDAHLNPNLLMAALLNVLEQKGVEIKKNCMLTQLERTGSAITSVFSGKERYTADQYVIASGSWSASIARLVNHRLPLMPGKGYSFRKEGLSETMCIPALLAEARVAITPMSGGLRIAGTMELDKMNKHIHMNRVRGIVQAIPSYFPNLNPGTPLEKDVWFGFRPASPDGLPYIGRSDKYKNLIFATGHGMMGISLGPATGFLVNQLVAQEKTEVPIEAFSPNRF